MRSPDPDRFVQDGDFAVTTRLIGDPTTPRHIPAGTFVRVLRVFPGTPPAREVGIAFVSADLSAIGKVKTAEHNLRVVTLQPGKCEPHIDEMHKRLLTVN